MIRRSLKKAIAAAPHLNRPADSAETMDQFVHRSAPPVDSKSIVWVRGLEDLRGLLLDTAVALGHAANNQYIDSSVRHEGQHARAAELLGATVLYYGLRFYRVSGTDMPTEGKIITQPLIRTTCPSSMPRLHNAAISAYPLELSASDLADVVDMGYASVGEVAEEAIAYNKTKGCYTVPVPLSHNMNSIGLMTRSGMYTYSCVARES